MSILKAQIQLDTHTINVQGLKISVLKATRAELCDLFGLDPK